MLSTSSPLYYYLLDNANRQPFGVYTHPIHIATGYPGVADPTATIAMINDFLDFVQQQDNVWIVSTEQMLDWVRHPVPVSQLNTLESFQCALPAVQNNICNGMHPNEDGLIQVCPFNEFPFYTCVSSPGFSLLCPRFRAILLFPREGMLTELHFRE